MPDVQSALHNTGSYIASTVNDTETALEHCKRFLEYQMQVATLSGVETSKLAAAYSELGGAYILNGNATDEALGFLKESEDIRRRLPEFEKVHLFNVLRYTAYYHILRREYDLANEKLLEAVADRCEKYGLDDRRGGRYVNP